MVHTTTVTPAMREVRRALKYAGVLSLVVAAWFGIGLSFCSVNPELSTQADHLLGSVTHIVCSLLLNSFGLMSFSVVLLIARFGKLLCSALRPQVTWSDGVVYLLFLILSATQLQLALNTTAFGASIGGSVGSWFATLLEPLGAMFAQGITCASLFAVFFTHSFVLQKSNSREKVDEATLNHWQSEVHLEARPVKSMNRQQQRDHSHVFEQVTAQTPEFDEEAKRFEAVESFYDDLAGTSNPALAHGEEHQDLIFKFDFEQDEDPSLSFDGSTNIRGATSRRDSADPRLTHESSSYRPDSDEHNTPLRLSRVSLSPDTRKARASSSVQGSLVEQVSQEISSRTLQERNSGPSLSPVEKLSQEISPKIAREMILQRGFDAQDLTLALIDTRLGTSIDHYFFTSPIAPLKPIYEVAECLNMHIRRALGRTEPPVLLTHKLEHGKHLIEVSWPRRSRVLTDTQEAVQVIRGLESQQSLNLYLGEAANGDQALLPFKSLKSVLITGGKRIDQEVGLDLLLMNLIHQSLPSSLRLIILDQEDHHATISQLPHLYCPVVSTSEQISDVLNWLPSEYRRRRSLMARLSLQNFEKLQEKKPQETRIVCVIPKLSQLNADQ
jgi:DNA segregation ATPase FtsK/SpoIIIE-like protein